MELTGADAAVTQASTLLEDFRKRAWPILHIQHLSIRQGATFFLPHTSGAEIHPLVRPHPEETVSIKHYPNAFRETQLLEHLRALKTKRLVFAGMMTHMCVDTTVRAAADLGFENLLAQDACATRALQFHERRVEAQEVQTAYLAALDGPFARVLPTNAIVENLTI